MSVSPLPRPPEQAAHLHRVSSWLTDLSGITQTDLPADQLATRIAALASMVAEDWPPAAFTHASLKHVAGLCRFFPAYAELSQALGAWWKEHRPLPPALPPPPAPARPEPPSEEAREAAHRLVRRIAAELGHPIDGAAAPRPVRTNPEARPGHLSDGQLLALYERLALEGNAPAATRLAMLRQKLGKNP